MAEFTADWQSLRPSFPFLDIDHMELLNQFKGVNPHILDNSILSMQNLMPFSSDNIFSSSEPEFQGNLGENLPGLVHHFNHNSVPVSPPISSVENESRKRKATNMSGPSSADSTPAVSESESKIKNVTFLVIFCFYSLLMIRNKIYCSLNWFSWNFYYVDLHVKQRFFCCCNCSACFQSSGRGKRVKKNMMEEEDNKSSEVVHVRARRGQATDSHSLAERV